MRTLLKTMVFGVLLSLCVAFSSSVAPAKPAATMRLLDFVKTEPEWVVVNDGVMGGVSSSSVTTSKGTLTFSGRVRLENNGGFASTRSVTVSKRTKEVLRVSSSLSLRVRGDGSTYQLTLDTGSTWFWVPISPVAGAWTTVVIPYAELRPHGRFGDPLSGPSYNGEPLRSIGLLISNKRAEQFRISLDWLGATT